MGLSTTVNYATSNPRALQGTGGRHELPPCALGPLSFGKRGRTGGVTSTNWTLNGPLSEPRTGEMENLWLGRDGVRDTSGLVTRPFFLSGRAVVQGHLDLDLCRFVLYPSKSGHRHFFPSPCLNHPRPFVPACPSFVKQAPGRSISGKPLPHPERSAEVVAQTFMRKIPGRREIEGTGSVAVVCRITANHWPGIARNALLRLASFRIGGSA